MTHDDYFTAAEIPRILRKYPLGDAFTSRYVGMSQDELRSLQDAQFARLMTRGWQIPFYARHWACAA